MNPKKDGASARPWQVSEYKRGYNLEIAAHDGTVCIVSGTSGTEQETKANTALIVQAVNEREALLEIAKAAQVAANQIPNIKSHGDYFAQGLAAQLNNALAKLREVQSS